MIVVKMVFFRLWERRTHWVSWQSACGREEKV